MTQETELSATLIDILACPACENRPKVRLHNGAFHCPQCGRAYPVENGIPIMLIDKARLPGDTGEQGR